MNDEKECSICGEPAERIVVPFWYCEKHAIIAGRIERAKDEEAHPRRPPGPTGGRGMSDATHAYIARCAQCGSVFAMTVDLSHDPKIKRHTASAIAQFVRDGGNVERVTIEQARQTPFGDCECHKKKPKAGKQRSLLDGKP